MSPELADWWARAVRSLRTAESIAESDPDAAASRAYYAAFYAVSGLFSNEGRSFRKHAAVQSALHRDLVQAGRWSANLGTFYSHLVVLRTTGDYGGSSHVTPEAAQSAIREAREILRAVRNMVPEPLPDLD